MNTRLKQFIAAENISQSQFADTIKVVRASVSHVLSGRNNPGYDFIKAIMSAYPNLNMDWLILGKGRMYKENNREETSLNRIEQQWQSQPEGDLFPEDSNLYPELQESVSIPADIPYFDGILPPVNIKASRQESPQPPVVQRKVSKVIIFFDDGSYQEM